jgi:adenosylmethionine-8-amino-7-oxononanoate aminotransferase
LDTRATEETEGTDDWVARSLRAVWHPCTQMKHHERLPLIPIARGAGPWLYDRAGQRYLDAISSWWVNLFGHANPRINAALKDQLDTLEHAMLAGCTHEPAVELAERLAALAQHTLGHAFFASDGASAVEIALKMSFHSWRNRGHGDKQEFVCIANSYHGETIGALGVTDVALFKDAYAPLLRHAHVVASPDARLAEPGESAADVARRTLDAVRALFEARSSKIAALIVEPLVQCAAGMAMHDASYIAGLRALCDQYGVHLIADEIAVGCGRTGTFFACEQAGIWPDFLCLSKGISGGYLPLSIVLSRDEIFAAFYDDDTAQKSATLRAALAPLAEHPQVRDLRQCGTIFAFDAVIADPQQAKTFSRRFFENALQRELLLRPISTTVYLMPPYILDDAELALLAARTHETFEATLAEAA